VISAILDEVKSTLSGLLDGALVMYDPQPISKAEPHVRLTYTGTSDAGDVYDSVHFTLSIVAAGDGPKVFLNNLIYLSLKVHQLFAEDGGSSRTMKVSGKECRLYIRKQLTGDGQFIQNEENESERTQFRYTYVEPYYIEVRFPKDLRKI
jgi:hypothetical protein